MERRWRLASYEKVLPQLTGAGLLTEAEVTAGLSAALQEIGPQHFIGRRPPERAYEQSIRGQELFVFRWESSRFSRPMYMKFTLSEAGVTIVSFHEAKE